MKQLSKFQSILFVLGGILMVIGVGCFVFMFKQQIVSWLFLVGTLLFATMQMMQEYKGNNMTISRLKNIMTLADLVFIFSGILMVDNVYGFIRPAFSNANDYVTYLYNKWVVLLLIAAILEIYTMHRIEWEIKKGRLFAFRRDIPAIKCAEYSVMLCNKYGVNLSEEEFEAILSTDKVSDEQTKYFGNMLSHILNCAIDIANTEGRLKQKLRTNGSKKD